MFVTPAPVCLLIVVFELGKIAISAMVLFCIHMIRLVFMTIPFMIVIVLIVMVGASVFVIFRSQPCWRHCYGDYKGCVLPNPVSVRNVQLTNRDMRYGTQRFGGRSRTRHESIPFLCSLELLGRTLPGQPPQCGKGQRRPNYSWQPLVASHLNPVRVGSSS
jgi:hypothetical protein